MTSLGMTCEIPPSPQRHKRGTPSPKRSFGGSRQLIEGAWVRARSLIGRAKKMPWPSPRHQQRQAAMRGSPDLRQPSQPCGALHAGVCASTAPTVDDFYEVFRNHFEAMARATHQDSPPHASRDAGPPPAPKLRRSRLTLTWANDQ